MKDIPTTATVVAKIKSHAKKIRDQYPSLGHARDAASKTFGYADYHHVVVCFKKAKPETPSADADLVRRSFYGLAGLIELDPIYSGRASETHEKLEESYGLDYLERHLQSVHAKGGDAYFDQACKDYSANMLSSGYLVTQEAAINSGENVTARLVWKTLLEEENSTMISAVMYHAFMHVYAGYLKGAADAAMSPNNRQTCSLLVETISRLITIRHEAELKEFFKEIGEKRLPRDMNVNVHTGEDDYAIPSTYWSRISASVSMEMAGLVGSLPISRIKAGKPPVQPTVVPQDPSLREQFLKASRDRLEQMVREALKWSE